ncbi:MAG: hypothetical protein JXB18_06735 [Sedimentisphaerales bacterium]|nr:hypothetical protein [Sedimentisphaerales bacterium]
MVGMVCVQLESAIGAVRILDPGAAAPDKTASAAQAKEVAALKSRLESLCLALEQAVQTVEAHGRSLFISHREQLIHLSIQIASRILARDIEKGHYEIDKILIQAIQQNASGPVLEIRLNPDDLKACEELIKNGRTLVGKDVKLTPDWSVGRAECMVETGDGIMECTIEEHLRQIETALHNVS